MKIIGTIGRNRFIIEAGDDEIARVAGFPYDMQLREKMKRDLAVGDVVSVSSMYDKIKGIQTSASRLTEAQSILRAVADLIEPIRACVESSVTIEQDGEPS